MMELKKNTGQTTETLPFLDNSAKLLYPQVQKAQERLFHIASRHKSLCFCWIPSHVGMKSNIIADREAKDAIGSVLCVIKKVPHSDMKKPIQSYIFEEVGGRDGYHLL